jgi:hypothetical protein
LKLHAYVSIRQHTSAYVSIRQHTPEYVSIRGSTRLSSSDVSTRQHTSAYVSIRQHTPEGTRHLPVIKRRLYEALHLRAHLPAYLSIRQHTSAYASIRQHTSGYLGKLLWPKLLSHHRLFAAGEPVEVLAVLPHLCHAPAYVSIRAHT